MTFYYKNRPVQILRDAVRGDPSWGSNSLEHPVVIEYQDGDLETVSRDQVHEDERALEDRERAYHQTENLASKRVTTLPPVSEMKKADPKKQKEDTSYAAYEDVNPIVKDTKVSGKAH